VAGEIRARYEKDGRNILNLVDFHVEPGRTIALVGPTGAGKTTIINLLSRFYDVSEGSVTIDGYDVRDVTLASLRRQMGVMLQDTFIFSGNVQAQSPLPSDTSENLIYSGRRVTSALTGNDQIGMIRCLSDNPQDLSAAVSQAKTMAGGKYDVTDDSARLSGVLQSVQTVRDLVRMVLLSVCLADVLVLAMALVFWIRSRIHEIGTLLALGIDKMRIVAQLAIETGLMAAVAALCSLGTGAMLSGYVSSRLLRDSGVAPLESLHVEALPPEQTMLILLLGCAVIAVALAVSCAAVLSKSPKSILSSMR